MCSQIEEKQSRHEAGTVPFYPPCSRQQQNHPELLVPCGSMETLTAAVHYGADAVYLGGTRFSLRAHAKNFDSQEIREAVHYAHGHDVKVYAAVNILAHHEQLEELPPYLKELSEAGVDALIVSDAGVIDLAGSIVPDMPLHLSTQASATNYRTMNFWYRQGIRRIVASREMSLEEIRKTRALTEPDLELEAFVHGAMCVSISGRCLLSMYMSGRDANQGDCMHPCRFRYALMEETRPGEYMPIDEDEHGTYILNARDLCMIAYIPEMIDAGIGSFKIEGRMKTALYVACVTKAYREAIDDFLTDPDRYRKRIPTYTSWLSMVSHRPYSTGFYLGRPQAEDQIYEASGYIQQAVYAGLVLEIRKDGFAVVEQRNKFSPGDQLTLLTYRGNPVVFFAGRLYLKDGSEISTAHHPKEHIVMRLPEEACAGMILMRSV